MLPSWRWFGPKDPVQLREIRQAGATGIVTALHEVRCGELWTREAIRDRRMLVEKEGHGLRWAVVESLPVHESIKTRRGPWREYVEIYKQSLRNLAAEGLRVICYNFMPVLDWTRTDLVYEAEDGSKVLFCDGGQIAAFDLFILRRTGAEQDYSAEELAAARASFQQMDNAAKKRLADTILMGLPGTVDDLTVEDFRRELERYKGIGDRELRLHLYGFLNEIMPVVEELGMQMAIHPDDPPRPIFGLPRILSTGADIEQMIAAVPSPNNGLTLCTGSLGGRMDNDPAALMKRFADRVFFAHFRNICPVPGKATSFHESPSHLQGRVDMYAAMESLVREERRRQAAGAAAWQIPLRPDHGKLFDSDAGKGSYPGYSGMGRMIGLAELRGLEYGIMRAMDATGGNRP